MNAILYLTACQLKNSLLSIVRRPAKLVVYLLTLSFFVWTFLGFSRNSPTRGGMLDIRFLHGMFLAWLLLIGLPTLLSSLQSGSAVFRMSDVNLLFVSPLSPKTILFYGLLRQMGGTLLGFVFFMMFYSGILTENFPVTPADVILMIASTVVFVVIMQVVALLAYSFINGEARRKTAVQAVIYAVVGLMALTFLAVFVRRGTDMEAALTAFASPYLEYFPLVGWVKGAVFALIAGDAWRAVLFLALLAASFALCLALFLKSSPDYYEDVLQRAEKTFELRQSMKEKRAVRMERSRPVKLGRTGLAGGWGASALFYKHLCEARRRSRLVFISTSTVILLLINLAVVFVAFMAGRNHDNSMRPDLVLAIGCAVSVYILFFLNAAGDWTRELLKPYIYLIPENPFRKLIWASMTTILKPVVDGTLIFAVTCAVAEAHPLTGLICMLIYASFGFLFTASSVLSQRVFGGMANKGLVMFLYMIMLGLVVAPAIGAMVAFYFLFRGGPEALLPFWIGLPVVVWNTLVSTLIFYACRNLLGTAEKD